MARQTQADPAVHTPVQPHREDQPGLKDHDSLKHSEEPEDLG